jgi:TPR repeat protein
VFKLTKRLLFIRKLFNINPIIPALILCLLVWKPAVSADFQRGLDAALKRDYITAIKEWEPLAERGDATPQFQLGWLYQEGFGVTQNYKTAVNWYTRAAEQGYAYAQSALGRMYELGQGVSQDSQRAYLWFSLAASLWDPEAKIGQNRVSKKLSLHQIIFAKKVALLCKQKNYKEC